jgi:phage-related protein
MKARYYLTPAGKSPVEEFIDSLPDPVRLEIVDAISLLDMGRVLSMPLSRNLSSIAPGLHELRFRDSAGQVRVVYFIKRREVIYLLHGFRKKTRDIPRRELAVIQKRLKEI